MEELQDLLAKLVGVLKEEYLVDQGMAGLLNQLLLMLSPPAMPLDPDLVQELKQIPDKVNRFKEAASQLGINDSESLKNLASSMKESGLLKSERNALERAKNADLITLPKDIDGTICGNCRFVDREKAYCLHKDVDQSLPAGIDAMCCNFWDNKDAKRAWEQSAS